LSLGSERPAKETYHLFCAAALNFLAATVSGSFFRVHALVVLLAVILAEFVILAFVQGGFAWHWAALNLVDVQIGYSVGIGARITLHSLGISIPSVSARSP
jgi:hypothetical protein